MNEFLKLLKEEVPPVKLGNKNKTGECGMCGIKVKKLYPRKVGILNDYLHFRSNFQRF